MEHSMLGVAVVLASQFLLVMSSIVCNVNKSHPCICSNGSITVDISAVFKQYPVNIIDKSSGDKYIYTPCKPMVLNGSKSALIWQIRSSGVIKAIGRDTNISWIINSTDPAQFTISYVGGDPYQDKDRSANVYFSHDGKDPNISLFDKHTPYYDFKVTGNTVAVLGVPHTKATLSAGIVGLVLIILCMVTVTMYCVAGVVYKYKIKGERGSDIIPNIAFWRELPFLFKDGVLFSLRPCTSRCKNSKTKYEDL